MQPKPECFSCFLKQALIASRLAKKDEQAQTRVQRTALRLLLAADWRRTPPAIATDIFRATYRTLRCADPYRAVKEEYNRKVKELYPAIGRQMRSARDPFTLAVKLALAGNIIDFGLFEDIDLAATLARTLRLPLPPSILSRFKERILKAGTILYLTDNAGEIGMDRFLLEEIRRLNPSAAVHLAVKKNPIINDATREDARYFGLEKLARLTDTGAHRVVGTELAASSRAFRRLFAAADLIVSKGQANWESLESLRDGRIVFLLKAKCPVVAGALGVGLNEAVIDAR